MSFTKTARNPFIDFLKGALILLVACGHAIQYAGYRDEGYWENPVFKGIYLFHMPLFMAVSGYVSFASLGRRPLGEVLVLRFRQLIVPIFASAVVCQVVLHLIHPRVTLVHFPREVVGQAIYSLWFLWALFAATVMAAVLRHFGRDTVFHASLSLVGVLLLVPEYANFHLFKYTLPFFWMGYFTARRVRDKGAPFPAWTVGRSCLLVLLLLSAVCYLLWTTDTYVYLTGMKLNADNGYRILLRTVTGVIVSGAVLSQLWRLYQNWPSPALIAFGENSLAIYILQGFIFGALEFLDHPWRNTLRFTLLAAPAIAVLVVVTCSAIGRWCVRVPVVAELFFGRTGTPARTLSKAAASGASLP